MQGTTRTGIGRMTGTATCCQRRAGVIVMDRKTLVGAVMVEAVGDGMTTVAVRRRSGLERAKPAVKSAVGAVGAVGILEGVLTVGQSKRFKIMTTGTVYRGAIIVEEHAVIELDAAVAMFTAGADGGRVGRCPTISVTDVAVIHPGAVMATVNLGITAVALADASDPGRIEVAMAVGALSAGVGGGGGAPLALPDTFVVMTVNQRAVRAAGRGRAGEVADGGRQRRIGCNRRSAVDVRGGEATGQVDPRMAGKAGTGRRTFAFGNLEQIVMGIG